MLAVRSSNRIWCASAAGQAGHLVRGSRLHGSAALQCRLKPGAMHIGDDDDGAREAGECRTRPRRGKCLRNPVFTFFGWNKFFILSSKFSFVLINSF